MISRVSFALLSLTGAAALSFSAPVARAQQAAPAAPAAEAEAVHPAAKVVKEYLGMILSRQWDHSADIVDEKSMQGLQNDYLARIQKAPTMDEEEAMVRRVGRDTLEQVRAMKPRDFYTAYHEGLQERYKVDGAVLALIRKTLTIRILSVAPEGDSTVHVLVRTKHSNGKVTIENLELVSLIKSGDRWKVALNEQAPKVTPVEGAPADPVQEKPADPVAAKPAAAPAKAPVKPAAKPAGKTPVKPAVKK